MARSTGSGATANAGLVARDRKGDIECPNGYAADSERKVCLSDLAYCMGTKYNIPSYYRSMCIKCKCLKE
ncbi:hypothetical protein O9K51_09661 [Purpureocillium lavendulum]|uniref:Uncharacterized protein n=1 Tax=Purpureocillium lavendulum TaxID=1247861 RepID=A0AB34FEF5_9HYPO|nr:hypothetical protein O9K51_09661 [Purpureocillium lavendulum]